MEKTDQQINSPKTVSVPVSAEVLLANGDKAAKLELRSPSAEDLVQCGMPFVIDYENSGKLKDLRLDVGKALTLRCSDIASESEFKKLNGADIIRLTMSFGSFLV